MWKPSCLFYFFLFVDLCNVSYRPGASKIFWISDKKNLTNGHKKKTELPLAGRCENNILNEETIEKQSGSMHPLFHQRR